MFVFVCVIFFFLVVVDCNCNCNCRLTSPLTINVKEATNVFAAFAPGLPAGVEGFFYYFFIWRSSGGLQPTPRRSKVECAYLRARQNFLKMKKKQKK